MSVGHLARAVEESGIPTVAIYVRAFAHVSRDMRMPRVVVTDHPFGRPIGPPNRPHRHRAVVAAALDLAEMATEGGTHFDMPGGYDI